MYKRYDLILIFITVIILGIIFAQENTYRSVSSTLKECYENKYLLEKDNRLPHTLNTLIAILQKIENTTTNINLQALTVGIMHR